jgi:hypothetical protein
MSDKPAAGAWYKAPSFAVEFHRFELRAPDKDLLLSTLGKTNLQDIKKAKFLEEVSVAMGGYVAASKHINSMLPSEVGKRLRRLRDKTHSLLGIDGGGISSLDDVTKMLLSEALSEKSKWTLAEAQARLLELREALDLALAKQKSLPNRWDNPFIRNLAYRLAIISRDVTGIEPKRTANGQFAKLVKEAARIAGKATVTKEIIFEAIDKLQNENVIKTGKKVGMENGAPIYEEIPVSYLRPYVAGYRAAGEQYTNYANDPPEVMSYNGGERIEFNSAAEYDAHIARSKNPT